MGYVGGLGAGKGWRILKVLPSIDLLAQILNQPNTQMFPHNSVKPDDAQLDVSRICTEYESWLNHWQSDEVEDFRRLRELSFQLGSIWTPINVRDFEDPPRRSYSTDRPTINFDEGRLLRVDPVRQITSAASTGIWMGFWISFPKVFASERTGWQLVDASNLPEWQIFDEIEALLKRSTKPLVVEGFDRKIRTAIRYSSELTEAIDRALIRHSAGFRRYGS